MQLFFSDSIPSEQRLALLDAELEAHTERLAQLHDDLNKFDGIPPADNCAFCDYMVLLGAIKREEPAATGWKPVLTYAALARDLFSPDRMSVRGFFAFTGDGLNM